MFSQPTGVRVIIIRRVYTRTHIYIYISRTVPDKAAESAHFIMSSTSPWALGSLGPLLTPTNFLLALLVIVGSSQVSKILHRGAHTARISGPPSPSWLFGVGRILRAASDPATMYEGWSRAHGSVYALPAAFGTRRIVLMDPKAISHCCARDTHGYFKYKLAKLAIQDMVSAHAHV